MEYVNEVTVPDVASCSWRAFRSAAVGWARSKPLPPVLLRPAPMAPARACAPTAQPGAFILQRPTSIEVDQVALVSVEHLPGRSTLGRVGEGVSSPPSLLS